MKKKTDCWKFIVRERLRPHANTRESVGVQTIDEYCVF